MKKIIDCMAGKRRIVVTEDNDVIQLLEGSGLPYWLYTDYCFPEGDEE